MSKSSDLHLRLSEAGVSPSSARRSTLAPQPSRTEANHELVVFRSGERWGYGLRVAGTLRWYGLRRTQQDARAAADAVNWDRASYGLATWSIVDLAERPADAGAGR